MRIVGVTAGRTAFRRTAPFYFAVAIVAGLAFGGNGMDAADLTALMRRSAAVRLSLWSLWLLGSAPAAHAILTEPRLFLLRSVPVPRWQVLAVHAALLFVVELPWIVLHTRGEGPLCGLAVACATGGLHAWLVARLRPWMALPWALAVLAVLLRSWPASVLLCAAVLLLAFALPTAYIRAPERAASAGPTLLSPRRAPGLALALAYGALLFRGQRPLLLRGALLCLLSGSIAALAITNNQVTGLDGTNTLSLGTLSVALLLSLVSVAAPLLRLEDQLDWLLSTTGASGRLRVASAWLSLALCGTLLALAHVAVLLAWLAPSADALPRLVGLPLLLALAVAAVAQTCLRSTANGDAKDSDRLLLLLLGVIPLCILFAWLFHEAVLLPWTLSAIAGTNQSLRRVLPLGRFERLRGERQRRAGDGL